MGSFEHQWMVDDIVPFCGDEKILQDKKKKFLSLNILSCGQPLPFSSCRLFCHFFCDVHIHAIYFEFQKQAVEKDVFQVFAEKVRDHKDLVSRWAVLQETRVEYFRGKDFVSFVRNHLELKDILESDRSLEAEDIANILLKKNLLVRCDRVVKTVRPGKKKLSTFPAHLEIYHDQVFSETDAFFAWTFVKRRPLWQTLLSFCWPVLTLAICLFPVYPHQVKLLILYSCAGVLLLILCLLLWGETRAVAGISTGPTKNLKCSLGRAASMRPSQTNTGPTIGNKGEGPAPRPEGWAFSYNEARERHRQDLRGFHDLKDLAANSCRLIKTGKPPQSIMGNLQGLVQAYEGQKQPCKERNQLRTLR
ncbi:hypothetical protein HAX54_015287 [Datura stramonium]|uniref:Translocation protein SEC62 n=1 Tax=Datura stramonium TaxID=4076 RepID=A0ABS8TQE2_DATST|nr:hypothetical protein [Datura stramonium]